jgi:peptidoglycan hydrolase CwlO-like protein
MFLSPKNTNPKIHETHFQNCLNLKKEVIIKPRLNKGLVVFKSVSKILAVTILLFLAFALQTNHQALAPIYFGFDAAQAVNDANRQALEDELAAVNKQIDEYQTELTKTQGEKNTLNNKINQLKIQANKLAAQVKATNLELNKLGTRIDDTTTSITKTNEEITSNSQSLQDLIEVYYENSRKSLIEILLANDQISDYFISINAMSALQDKIKEKIDVVTTLKTTLESQQQVLEQDQNDTQGLLQVQLSQQQQLTSTKSEQETLLALTKNKESAYQTLLADRQAKAAEIKSRIYDLMGVKSQVNFGEALAIATSVSSQISIRPAFLLAVLTQESNLGKNVGTCNRPGDPPSKSWKVQMKPSRDQAPFVEITKNLGLNPDTTPISCAINDSAHGLVAGQNSWGGAMGPAQFIPSTWMGYLTKIQAAVGHYPNPWDIRDAMTAAAIKLSTDGANAQTSAAECTAAKRYFGGNYQFYCDSVLRIATGYEQDIADINNAK